MDSGGDESDDEYEQHPCHWVELGLGAARILVPKHWSVESRELAEATFAVAEIAGATFSVGLTCFEDPEAIRANALISYLNHPAAPPLSEDSVDSVREGDGRPDYGRLTVHFGCTECGGPGGPEVTAEIDIWRCIHVAPPDHVRLVEFRFRTPPDTDPDFRRMLLASLRALVAETEWAPEELTKFDRIAPADGLKLSRLWGCIYLRVPEAWQREREHEDGTGMYLFDDRERGRWTLWIDYDRFAFGEGEEADEDRVRDSARALAEKMKDDGHASTFDPLDDRPGEALVTSTSEHEEDGELLHYVHRTKLVAIEAGMMMAKFNWVVRGAHVGDEDMPALCALVEREIRNALVIAPAATAEDPPAEATADGWKTVVLWDALRLNVPEDAEPCFDDTELGVLCKFDDPAREMWTLWVRMVRLPSPDPRKVPDRATRRAVMQQIVGKTVEGMLARWAGDEATVHTERLPEPGAGFLAGMKRTHDSNDVNDGERLLHTDWHRIAVIGDDLFDLFFEWVIVERVAAEPAMQALSERIAREVMRAKIVPA